MPIPRPCAPCKVTAVLKGFQDSSVVKSLPASAGDARHTSLIPGQEDPLGKGMATPSNILSWKIPQTEEPGGL